MDSHSRPLSLPLSTFLNVKISLCVVPPNRLRSEMMQSIFGRVLGPTLCASLFRRRTSSFFDIRCVDLRKSRVNVLLRQYEIPKFQMDQAFQSMTICPFLPWDNLSFERAAAVYYVAAVLDRARPPSTNDVLPLLGSTLFIPLVQPLREVDRTSDLKVNVAWIRLV